ncbi:LuxR C-terminal-related transcriptional regulator [Streptomyces sp. NPDC053427]|uniref:helix-turn-helix transcriptional regulator n=1 Tax=Streptomyces sp. NPDC053427 TaxID=3365701 RepID=UPI0037D78D3B
MLLEREAELVRIRAALDAAQAGDSSLLVATGPLGSGRSALLCRLPELVDADTRVLRANASLRESDFAFGAVRQLFDPLLSATGVHKAPGATTPHDRFGPPTLTGDRPTTGTGGALADSEAVQRSAQSLLAEAGAGEQPRLLILVDDLQWVDGPSLRWLAHLTRRQHGLRAVVVCTLADGDHRARHPLVREVVRTARDVLPLAPLSPEGIRTLFTERHLAPAQDAYARAVHDATGGNPLFVTALRRALGDTGRPPTAELPALCPAEVRDRIAGHLRIQPQPVRDVAAAVAALGDHSDPTLLAELAGIDEVGFLAARRVLTEAGLLAAGREIRFVHRVVRDAVDACQTHAERERSHNAAADLLYRCGRPAEQVAAHLRAVVHPGRPWSATVLRSAADTALRDGRPVEAARYLRSALLHHRTQDEHRARVLVDLATVERAFDPDACERHLTQAIALLHTPGDRAAATLRIPLTLLGTPSATAAELLRDAAAALDDADVPHTEPAADLALRLEARLRHSRHETPVELESSADRLRSMGPRPQLNTVGERELVSVLLWAGTLAGSLTGEEAARTGNRILEREPATAARAHTTLPLVMASLCAAESVRGASSWLAGDQRTRRMYAPGADDVLQCAERAFVLMAKGRAAPAREHVERALSLDAAHWQPPAVMSLASVAFELRDPVLSERILAHARYRRPAGLALGATLQILQGVTDAQNGRSRKALGTLLTCGRQLEVAGWRNSALFPWRPYAIGLHKRLGEAEAALRLAEDELAWARAWGAPTSLGRALRLKGWLLGGDGLDLLREAVDTLRSSPYEVELARTLVLLARRGGGPEAAALLREAAEIAAACGIPWLAERAERDPDSTRVPPSTVLTPSERRIVSMVADGLSNQDIANELGVSCRAVEKHLTSSYRKLGVSGRRELVTALPG